MEELGFKNKNEYLDNSSDSESVLSVSMSSSEENIYKNIPGDKMEGNIIGPDNMINTSSIKDKTGMKVKNINANMPKNMMSDIIIKNDVIDDDEYDVIKLNRKSNVVQLQDTFSNGLAHYSGKVGEIEKAYNAYKSEGYFQTDERKIELLNGIISSCRWYIYTGIALSSSAIEKKKLVKRILSECKANRTEVQNDIAKEAAKRKAMAKKHEEEEKEAIRLEEEQAKEMQGKGISYIHEERHNYQKDDKNPTLAGAIWAGMKAYTFGFLARNIINTAMGAVAGATWLATYPFAALTGWITGKKKYYKGFNIKIPHPMSPNGWFNYYMYGQQHALSATGRVAQNDKVSNIYQVATFIGKSLQYNAWNPIKHLLTLNMKHLSGGGYIAPHYDKDAISAKADKDYNDNIKEYIVSGDDDGEYDDDE